MKSLNILIFYHVLRIFKTPFPTIVIIFEEILNSTAMKQHLMLIALLICIIATTHAQQTDQKSKTPKEDIKVNREYDENGNLIRFDSLYTYSWSGDTTLLKSFSPADFPDPFSFFSDSTFRGNSFFDGFDQLFSTPFSTKRDSLLLQKFGMLQPFSNFGLNNDSVISNRNNLDLFFDELQSEKKDSISSKTPGNNPNSKQPKSVDDMIKMLQQHMQEMEEQQRKFFKEQPKWEEF